MAVGEWLRGINKVLERYAEDLTAAGYNNPWFVAHCDEDALQEVLVEINMKKPHRKSVLTAACPAPSLQGRWESCCPSCPCTMTRSCSSLKTKTMLSY